MSIVHNVYFDGKVQSLGHVENKKTTMTVGMLEPGEYDFGQAGPREVITVTSGALTINGKEYLPKGNACVIESGGSIKIEAKCVSTYICHYG